MMLFNLDDLVEISGHTSDEEFQNLLEKLDELATLVHEEEELNDFSETIIQIYESNETTEKFELWYQVRTPDSPEGMEFAFGFGRVS